MLGPVSRISNGVVQHLPYPFLLLEQGGFHQAVTTTPHTRRKCVCVEERELRWHGPPVSALQSYRPRPPAIPGGLTSLELCREPAQLPPVPTSVANLFTLRAGAARAADASTGEGKWRGHAVEGKRLASSFGFIHHPILDTC